MENKTIEFVCTANNGRSTISRAIAQDYLVRQNLDLELISQFFYRDIPLNDEENEFKNLLEGIYLRFKYSF